MMNDRFRRLLLIVIIHHLAFSISPCLFAQEEVIRLPAVVPTVTGRAWITGMAQYMLDPVDPFPEGFEL